MPFTAKRRWFKYSLRTLFVVVTVLVLVVGSFANRASARKQECNRIAFSKGWVGLGQPLHNLRSAWLLKLDRLFGDSEVYTILLPEKASDAERRRIEALFPEAIIWERYGRKATDERIVRMPEGSAGLEADQKVRMPDRVRCNLQPAKQ